MPQQLTSWYWKELCDRDGSSVSSDAGVTYGLR